MAGNKATNLVKSIVWFLWDFLGVRFIWIKINAQRKETTDDPKYKPPRTFVLWLIGIYVTFFGVASLRYENRVDKIENRANSIFTQLSTTALKQAIGKIPRTQQMLCPYKPNILKPHTVFRSLFWKDVPYSEMVNLLKETIETWKDSLDSVNLSEANLRYADLVEANLQRATLRKANLQEADLWKANLQRANLTKANLKGTHFMEANLQRANLTKANLKKAHLWKANLQEAHLLEAKNLRVEQLCAAKTLYKAELDIELEKQIKEKCPHLFEAPEKKKKLK